MKNNYFLKSIYSNGLIVILLITPPLFASAQTSLNDGSGAYATGKYRNLFKEQGHSDKEITKKIDSAFQQLFHGDTARQAAYFDAGENENGKLAYVMCRIMISAPKGCRTE